MENAKDNIQLPAKTGIIPVIGTAIKNWLWDNDFESSGEGILQDLPDEEYTTQTLFQRLTGAHSFNRKGLRYLVETGYTQNPAGFGIINKILLSQRNINFMPYWKGTTYKSKVFDLDINFALQMLLLTGTVMFYKKEIVGLPGKLVVLNTLNVTEIRIGNKFIYRLDLRDGTFINLQYEDLIIIKFADITSVVNTNMGLSPFQAALMPIESLREMYTADTATLKNKGVDVLITNDSEEPFVNTETKSFDEAINERVSGARRSGGVATSTAKLRVLQLGRTTKELALWDGYKIKLRDLCNVLQVDSGQFNDPDNKKFSNVQESNKSLYNDCVIPFTKLITENRELKDFLGYDIYLDTSGIDCLQEAQKDRFEKNSTITDAIISLNSEVQTGTITVDIAVKILTSEWGFDEQEAKGYIKIPDAKPDPETVPANTEPAA